MEAQSQCGVRATWMGKVLLRNYSNTQCLENSWNQNSSVQKDERWYMETMGSVALT
jgi:hypothetical protein